MTDLKGDDYERAFYRDWEAGKVKDGNGKRVMPQRDVQETIAKWIKANTEHRQWYICPKCSYQAPRFRDEWVGLTDAEIMASLPSALSEPPLKLPPGWRQFADALDAKLKEKNGG